jgi:hypothetical protein
LDGAALGTSIRFVFAGTQPQILCEIDRIATQCIRAGTPAAAAGIVKGERSIVSLDGTAAAQLTLGSLHAAFLRASGTRL